MTPVKQIIYPVSLGTFTAIICIIVSLIKCTLTRWKQKAFVRYDQSDILQYSPTWLISKKSVKVIIGT